MWCLVATRERGCQHVKVGTPFTPSNSWYRLDCRRDISGLTEHPGGTQYKSGYRDVPQTWVAKSGRQVHQWVPFFSKTWYFDGSIFQNFLKFAPKWRKFGTLIGQLLKFSENLRQNGANFSEKFWFLVHGWATFPSKWVHGWVAFQKSQRHTPTQTKVEYPPGTEHSNLYNSNEYFYTC